MVLAACVVGFKVCELSSPHDYATRGSPNFAQFCVRSGRVMMPCGRSDERRRQEAMRGRLWAVCVWAWQCQSMSKCRLGVCNDGVCGAFAMSPIKSTRTVEKKDEKGEKQEQKQKHEQDETGDSAAGHGTDNEAGIHPLPLPHPTWRRHSRSTPQTQFNSTITIRIVCASVCVSGCRLIFDYRRRHERHKSHVMALWAVA